MEKGFYGCIFDTIYPAITQIYFIKRVMYIMYDGGGDVNMAGLVQELKRGNQTLTRKIEVLEQQVNKLKEENRELKMENFNLTNKLEILQSEKELDESNIIKCFATIYNKIL